MSACTATPTPSKAQTYSTKLVARLSGASYRQLDYWCRTGLLHVDGDGQGQGVYRRWSEWDVAAATMLYRLRGLGLPSDVAARALANVPPDPADGGWPCTGTLLVPTGVPGVALTVDLHSCATPARSLAACP